MGADEPRRRRISIGGVGRLVVVTALALFVALLTYGLATNAPDGSVDESLAEARPAPAPPFTLPVLQPGSLGRQLGGTLQPALADGRVALRELRGTPMVLNFWASWCVPCRTEAPLLERMWRQARKRGVLFVGLNMQDLTDDARAFMNEFRVSYLNVRDKSNGVAREWGVTGLPETFFVTAEGKVVGHVIGAISAQQLAQGMRATRSGVVLGARDGGDRRSTR